MLPPFELLLLALAFSLLDVELVLDAGEDRFCEAADDEAALPCGDVFTDSGDVSPAALAATGTLPVELACPLGVELRAGALVLKSCGEATLVDDAESAYLQLAAALNIPGL